MPFVDERVDWIPTNRQSPHSNMLLTPDFAAASRLFELDAPDDLQIKFAAFGDDITARRRREGLAEDGALRTHQREATCSCSCSTMNYLEI